MCIFSSLDVQQDSEKEGLCLENDGKENFTGKNEVLTELILRPNALSPKCYITSYLFFLINRNIAVRLRKKTGRKIRMSVQKWESGIWYLNLSIPSSS